MKAKLDALSTPKTDLIGWEINRSYFKNVIDFNQYVNLYRNQRLKKWSSLLLTWIICENWIQNYKKMRDTFDMIVQGKFPII